MILIHKQSCANWKLWLFSYWKFSKLIHGMDDWGFRIVGINFEFSKSFKDLAKYR